MKNFRLFLSVAALVSLICVLTPCVALAQGPGPIPPFHPVLSSVALFGNSEMQSLIVSSESILHNMEGIHSSLPGDPATMPKGDRLIVAMVSKALGMPARIDYRYRS